MAVLHLLANPNAVPSCVAALAADDAVLALGDGVFALAALGHATTRLGVLRDDAESRGVEPPAAARQLSQADFVDWVVAYGTSVTWR